MFFNSVKTEIPLLIEVLPELVADLEKNMHRFRTPASSPPDNPQAINEEHAEDLLSTDNTVFLFNDLHQQMSEALKFHEAVNLLLNQVNSRELDLQQQVAYECVTKFAIIKEQLHSEACAIRVERNERAAEIVETRS